MSYLTRCTITLCLTLCPSLAPYLFISILQFFLPVVSPSFLPSTLFPFLPSPLPPSPLPSSLPPSPRFFLSPYPPLSSLLSISIHPPLLLDSIPSIRLDREIDPLSPLVTPLTYEGLISELMQTDYGKLRISPDKDSKVGVEGGGPGVPAPTSSGIL